MNTMYTIFVCGNDETLFDGTYFQLAQMNAYDEGVVVVEAGCRVIDAHDEATSECQSYFHDWHGGRFDQLYKRHGWTACAKDAPQWVHDLADKADDAMRTEVARLDNEAEQEDRELFATELEQGEALTDKVAFIIENQLLSGYDPRQYTTASVAAALRAADPALLVVAEVIDA